MSVDKYNLLFKTGSWLFLAKEYAQVLINRLEDYVCPGTVWFGKTDWHDM